MESSTIYFSFLFQVFDHQTHHIYEGLRLS